MSKREKTTIIQRTTELLRAKVLDAPDGAFIGSEEALIQELGRSRTTIRQVARVLEQEGLLSVKRGINGGYFGSRPNASTIEATVSAYLETLDMDPQDVTSLASALWVEAMRKAASADKDEVRTALKVLRRKVSAVKDTASFSEIRALEVSIQSEVLRLAKSDYIRLIFNINTSFSVRKFVEAKLKTEGEEHLRFVQAWRGAKLLEFDALLYADQELATLAGQHSRKVWTNRLKARYL